MGLEVFDWESYAKRRNEQPGPKDVPPRTVLEVLKAVAEGHQASDGAESTFVTAVQSFYVGQETTDEDLLNFIRLLRLSAIDHVESYRRQSWLYWLQAANGINVGAPISRLVGAMCFVLHYCTVDFPRQRSAS